MSISMRITQRLPLRPWMEPYASPVLSCMNRVEAAVELIWKICVTLFKRAFVFVVSDAPSVGTKRFENSDPICPMGKVQDDR